MPDSKDDLRRQLTELNEEIAQLGGDRDALYQDVGGEDQGAQDPNDVAAQLTNAEETEAMLEALYAKRERLHDQLGE